MTMTFDRGREGEQLAQEGYYKTAAVMLDGAFPEPVNLHNRANCLRRLARYQEAYDVCKRALAIRHREETVALLGALALDLGRPEEAIATLEPIKHQHHFYAFSYALACLHKGDWVQGFHHYDSRLHDHRQPLPMWEGEDLQGQTLAITCEQGLGDSIMFSRFREMIPGKHILLTSNALTRLLDGHSGNRPFEAWKMVPLMSLPRRLGITSITPPKPYIRPLERFDVPRLADTRLAVGIVWRSKAGGYLRRPHEIEHGNLKSIPLEMLLPLAAIPGVKLYSLQIEGDADIGELGAGPLVENLGVRIMDMADLASFMQEMDVIVTVDTAPAHLAGAMGKDCIVMLNYQGAWQWGSGERTPWYATTRAVRQRFPGDWDGVVEEVGRLLR